MSLLRVFRSRGLTAAIPFTLAFSCMGVLGDTGETFTLAGNRTSDANVPSSADGPIVSAPSVASRFPRLNHQQWENTVRDLLRLSARTGLAEAFLAEPLRSSFDNNGSVLSVSPDLWTDYQSAAETLAKMVAHDSNMLAAIETNPPSDPDARAKAFIQAFGLRAFRRPLTDAEVRRYLDLYAKGPTLFGTEDSFIDGIELVLTAFFQSPHFLYREETSTKVSGRVVTLNDYEIASRLSYGLLNTMPDDALLAAAAGGKLHARSDVLKQAQRLLKLPTARENILSFHEQLLRMRNYDTIKADPAKAPSFTEGVGADLKQETLTFIGDVIFQRSKGLTDLLTAPYTFANSRIAQMYGLERATPREGQPDPFVRMDLDPTQRAGLLTQVGFLASNAEGSVPNIIIRGVHVAKDILCVELAPPPNVVPQLPALSHNSTNRQRVDALTKNAPCSGCHTKVINPIGFAFETLDGFGRYRTTENGQKIDATGSYTLDGKEVAFNGPVELINAIANSRQAHDCYSRHLVEYLYGRDVDTSTDADRNLVTQAGARSRAEMSVQDLILNLVATEAFLTLAP